MSSMSYSRICSMRSIQKTTFCGFIALLNKVLDFGGQLADKLSFILGTYTHLQTTRCSDTIIEVIPGIEQIYPAQ